MSKQSIKPSREMKDYESRHEAMMLIGCARWRVEGEPHEKMTRAINYLRDTAYDVLPWSADILSNKTWDGRRA